jgi:hypothetical protein
MKQIEFIDFLQQSCNRDFWENNRMFCFKGFGTYPGMFFQQLMTSLEFKEVLPAKRKKILFDSLGVADLKRIVPLLYQVGFGSKEFYWLGNISRCFSLKNSQKFLKDILSYKGQHFISFFVESNTKISFNNNSLMSVVKIENNIGFLEFKLIAKRLNHSIVAENMEFAKALFLSLGYIHLDLACFLAGCLSCLNPRLSKKFLIYLQNSLFYQQTLMDLSDRFFSRDAENFFRIWYKIKDEYPEVFWVIYWSNQLWKACNIVKFLQDNNFIFARRMAIGIPFSFMKENWKRFTLSQVKTSLEMLYAIDFEIKNGSSFCALDMFYFNHFSKRDV